MKNTLSIILSVIMIASLFCCAYAESADVTSEPTEAIEESTSEYEPDYAALKESLEAVNNGNYDPAVYSDEVITKDGYVTDKTGLLTDEEKTALENKLAGIREKTGYETAILTIDGDGCTETNIESYGEKYYTENFSGDGALLIIYKNNWNAIFFGKAETLANYSNEWITDTIRDYLHSGKYSEGLNTFADITNDIYTGNVDESKYRIFNWKLGLIISIVAGLLVAFIVTSKFKSELKSVSKKADANDYAVPGSLQILEGNEIFLYSNVTKTAKAKSNPNGGGGHSGPKKSIGGKF